MAFPADYSTLDTDITDATNTDNADLGKDHATAHNEIHGALNDLATQATADEAYGSAWNGKLEFPTKNAVYDKIETLQKRIYVATMYRSTNQTGVADATWTDVDFSHEMFDDSTLSDISTNQFTAPAAGRCRLTGAIDIAADGPCYVRIYKNGTTVVGIFGGWTSPAPYGTSRLNVDTGWKTCASGDTFKLMGFADVAAGTATFNGDTAGGGTWATMEFIAD